MLRLASIASAASRAATRVAPPATRPLPASPARTLATLAAPDPADVRPAVEHELEQHVTVTGAGAMGETLATTRGFAAGELVYAFTSRTAHDKSRYSIQVGRAEHTAHEGLFALMNHSCKPSCYLWPLPLAGADDAEGRARMGAEDGEGLVRVGVFAARDLAAGEAVNFDYRQTEWEMATPFECACPGVEQRCAVAGASALPPDAQRALLADPSARLWPHVSEQIRMQSHQRQGPPSEPPASAGAAAASTAR